MTAPKLKIEMWPIDKVLPYAQNARLHPNEQVATIARSIAEFGFVNPCLVDADGVLIAGHGRILAAKQLGIDTVPVIRLGHMTEQQARAYRLADNAISLQSRWSPEMLKVELTELKASGFNLDLTGFPEVELVQFLTGVNDGADPEVVPEPLPVPVSQTGDIWLLGNHRLMCGDATKADDVAVLLDGAEPHLMVTDPPYGVEYDPDWRNRADRANGKPYGASAVGIVGNDDRANWEVAWKLFPGDVVYAWHPEGARSVEHHAALVAAGFDVRMQIIWAKQQFPIGRGNYHVQHEPCWYAVRRGKTAHWSGDRTQSTLWEIDKPRKSETGHSTQKPIECMRRPIQNNSRQGDSVYDPFLGSGTTMIASEMMGRKCYGMEISPAYVDVCVRRWETFTKKQATLANDGRTWAELAAEAPQDAPDAAEPTSGQVQGK